MSDTDPILRAISDGNTSCPDGRALAQLGELVRIHSGPPRAVDLAGRVRSQLDADAVRIVDEPEALSVDEQALVDGLWDGDQPGSPELVALSALIGGIAPPAAIDLTAAVRRSLKHVEAPAATTITLDSTSRWRMWSAVIAVHVAAILAITLFQNAMQPPSLASAATVAATSGDGAGSGTGIGTSTDGHADAALRPAKDLQVLPVHLPGQWSDLQAKGGDLFLLRRFPEVRQAALGHYGMAASHDAIEQGVAWLTAQSTATGTFGPLSGAADRDLATQSLAALALIGEGLDDHARMRAVRSALGWIDAQLTNHSVHTDVATGMACLALVEGATLSGDALLRLQAEQALRNLDHGEPPQPGAAGLGGFTLLALETAVQENLSVPARSLIQARRSLARSLPQQENDYGRIGLAAFARMIYGMREQPSTAREIQLLTTMLPAAHDGQSDPLGWFFPTLAMREAGGAAWDHWAAALQNALLPQFQSVGPGLARVHASQVHYADVHGGDVFATSLAVLDLQVPYRYVPLAR